MPLLFDPSSPAFRADPYPYLARQRAEDPLCFVDPPGLWIVARHADASFVLRDERFSARRGLLDRIAAAGPSGDVPPVVRRATSSMLMRDAPDHTRLRTLVSKAFTPRVVESLRTHVEDVGAQLLDRMRGQRTVDLVGDYAFPLSLTVIAELLGVFAEDRDRLRRWSDDLTLIIDGTIALEHLDRLDRAMNEFSAYLTEIFAARRREPREDLITGLLHAQEAGDSLTEDELLTTCMLVLAAGHETTTDLIGSGTLALLRHPAERERLRREPALARSAVEELLRYESPVQFVTRTAHHDVELAGHTIGKGREVVVLIGAANRDPDRFARPDDLDLGRTDNRHLAFGHGSHFCLGAQLARLEAQIAIPAFLDRHPGVRLGAEPISWRPGFVLRGLRTLPLILE